MSIPLSVYLSIYAEVQKCSVITAVESNLITAPTQTLRQYTPPPGATQPRQNTMTEWVPPLPKVHLFQQILRKSVDQQNLLGKSQNAPD